MAKPKKTGSISKNATEFVSQSKTNPALLYGQKTGKTYIKEGSEGYKFKAPEKKTPGGGYKFKAPKKKTPGGGQVSSAPKRGR